MMRCIGKGILSKKLTYPTWGKGKSSKVTWVGTRQFPGGYTPPKKNVFGMSC